MNLDTCTEAQRASVRHLDGPLFIAAGAGSGKTFTLQQRIVYALLPESGPACDSIDEVLAITFMEKAAGEVKSRVRAGLRAEGLLDEALKVDAAWISTIHGMCSRILRENALEAGVDPRFAVLSDFESRQLLDEALETVLAREQQSGAFRELFAEYGARKASSGHGGTSVQDMVSALLDKASSFAEGLGAIDFGPPPASAERVAAELLSRYEEALGLVEAWMGRKPTKTQQATHDICLRATEALRGFLMGGPGDFDALLKVLVELGVPRRDGFGRKCEDGARTVDGLRAALAWAFDTIDAARGSAFAGDLRRLARKVEEEYQGMLDAAGVLSNDELLHRTLRLLRGDPAVAASYRRRFKLVMVDEFQDTNELQVELISLVAGTDRLCTVGDAQQSIYRFNGADVGVFNRQKRRVEADETGGALVQRLDDNFRSHGDVLAFVRRVCGQDEVFGADFLDLRASRAERGRYRGSGPRVEVLLCSYEGGKNASGAVLAQARDVAERFAALRAAGHGAGEMVVLMAAMTDAEVYAQALREQGFSCVLGGGRGFFAAEEVQTVRCALDALAEPADTEALFGALSGGLVRLSAEDFLLLCTARDETGRPARRDLDRGMREAALEQGPAARTPSSALAFALELFDRARRRMDEEAPSRVLKALFVESGWMARLEAQGIEGISRAANVMKALRMIEELEAKPGSGFASVARDFRAMADTEKEGPGSLSVTDQNAVRIMTIHKAKGLEFPIVAVGGCEPRGVGRATFLCDAVDGRVWAALSAGRSKVKRPKDYERDALETTLVPAAPDAAVFAEALCRRANDEELAEARRKFYVACTRASEYLLVCGLVRQQKTDPLGGYKAAPVFDDVRRALMGEEDFPEGEAALDYGGSEPLRFVRRRVAAQAEEPPTEQGDESSPASAPAEPFMVPVLPKGLGPERLAVADDVREGVFSYSSIAPHDVAMADQTLPQAEDKPGPQAGPSATDLGSAFHRVAQLAVLQREAAGGLRLPDAARVDAIACAYGAGEGEARARLDAALARWFSSAVCARADAQEVVSAEVPFMLPIDCDGEECLLEGEIDLLACDRAGRHAFVVDYKTGGSDLETPGRLQEKHRLQATCYAYALLAQGFEDVEFAFVRVERCDVHDASQPQVVPYRFTAGDSAAVKALIARARGENRRRLSGENDN